MDLLAFERKLDQTIMRKRVDIQEALKRPMKVSDDKYILPLSYSVMAHTRNSLVYSLKSFIIARQFFPKNVRFQIDHFP